MCCAIVAMLLALFPAWTGGRDAVVRWLSNVRHVAAMGGAMIALLSGTAIAAGSYPQATAHICSVLTGF
jgi:hypothetical protein